MAFRNFLLSAIAVFLSFQAQGQSWKQLYDQASADFNTGAYYQAISTLVPALAMAKSTFDKNPADTMYATTLYLLGDCHWWVGNYEETEKYFKDYLSLVKSRQGEKNEAYAGRLADLAALYYDMGRYQEAEAFYKKALVIDREVIGSDHLNYITTLNNLAVLYDAMGHYGLAEPMYREVITGYRSLLGKTDPTYGTAINNLAAFYYGMGRYEEAKLLLKEAAEIHLVNNGEQDRQYATALNNLASVNIALNQMEEAIAELNKALEIRKKLVGEYHMEYLISLSNLARVYLDVGDPQMALKLAGKASTSFLDSLGNEHPSYLNALSNQAMAYLQLGYYKKAETLLEQVTYTRKEVLGAAHPLYANSLNNLAAVYIRQKDYQKGEALLKEALHHYLGHIQTYFPGLSEQEKEKYLTNIQDYFEAFNSFMLLQENRNELLAGLQYNNQLILKAILLDLSRKVRQNILNSGDQSLILQFEEWQAQREQLAKYYQFTLAELEKQGIKIDSLKGAANTLEKSLSAQSGLFSKAYGQSQPTWQDVQQALKDHEAALEMVRFRKYDFDSTGKFTDIIYYAALVITPQRLYPEVIFFDNGNLLEGRLLKAYRNDMQKGWQVSDAYQYYWQPLTKALRGVKSLYFSPDGVYHQINIATLFNPETQQYLLDELKIISVTSTRDLLDTDLRQEKHGVAGQQAILMGSPDFNLKRENNAQPLAITSSNIRQDYYLTPKLEREYDLKPLAGAREEIARVAEIIGRNHIDTAVYLAEDALEETIKQLNNPKILHIATHGYFAPDAEETKNYGNPLLQSGIFLAGANRSLHASGTFDTFGHGLYEDGVLTAYEAINLNLDQTELVVLSACETGLGEIRNGEGVYGLQRALKVAGAKSILMSLWKVDDRATQALMTTFYEYWLSRGNKAEAFRQAQQKLREQYPDPYYWGAFVLIGQ